MMIPDKLVVYAYLFAEQFDEIVEYKIHYRDGKFKVYKVKLDKIMQEFPDQMLWHVADELSDALQYVVQNLRSIEIDNGTYPKIPKGDLPVTYLPVIAGIEEQAQADGLPSVTFFGSREKYNNPMEVQKFLDTFGYGNVKTWAPYVYVLSDFVKEEFI
jgi:hypothetical protein